MTPWRSTAIVPAVFEEAASKLRARFGAAAKTHARSAMVSYRAGDAPGFYLNAGTSLELAIKARLMAHGAFTIGPDGSGWFRHVMAVVKSPDAGASARGPTTVGGVKALERLRLLEPDLDDDVFDDRVRTTIDRCEVAKHIGLGEAPSPEVLLSDASAFVRAHDALLSVPAAEYWGDEHVLTGQLVKEQIDAVDVRVRSKIVDAKSRMKTLGEDAVDELGTLEAQKIADADEDDYSEWVEVECPVCGSSARAFGWVYDHGEGESEYEGPNEVSWHWLPRPVTLVTSFACEVCHLALSGSDELRSGEVPTTIDNKRVDPMSLVEDPW